MVQICARLAWSARAVAKSANRFILLSDWKARSHGPALGDTDRSPVVGVVIYIVIRRIWEREENSASVVVRRDPSATTPAEETSTDS